MQTHVHIPIGRVQFICLCCSFQQTNPPSPPPPFFYGVDLVNVFTNCINVKTKNSGTFINTAAESEGVAESLRQTLSRSISGRPPDCLVPRILKESPRSFISEIGRILSGLTDSVAVLGICRGEKITGIHQSKPLCFIKEPPPRRISAGISKRMKISREMNEKELNELEMNSGPTSVSNNAAHSRNDASSIFKRWQ